MDLNKKHTEPSSIRTNLMARQPAASKRSFVLSFRHLLADLLVALRGDQHFDAGLVHVVNVGPVGLNLRIFDAAGQAVNSACGPDKCTKVVYSAMQAQNCIKTEHLKLREFETRSTNKEAFPKPKKV